MPFTQKIILYPESEKDFYVKGQYLFIHFNEDETGKVNGFQLEHFNGEDTVNKIE